MKRIFIMVVLLAFTIAVFSQSTPTQPSKNYYVKKSRQNTTIAWVLLGGGATISTIGIVEGLGNGFVNIGGGFSTKQSSLGNGTIMIILGGLVGATSIPFFISARQNEREASKITLGNEPVYLPQKGTIALKSVPAIKLTIRL